MNATSSLYAPWVLAEVARASLIYGTDFNRKPATDKDLRDCCAAYQALRDPELGIGKQGAVGHFMLRVAGSNSPSSSRSTTTSRARWRCSSRPRRAERWRWPTRGA